MQIGVAKHSHWSSSAQSIIDIAESRAKLGETLTAQLRARYLDLLAWAGDGGMFYKAASLGWDDVVEDCQEVFRIFDTWRHENSESDPGRVNLQLRCSVHKAEAVAHPNTGFWFGTPLNDFFKFERRIAEAGAIAITSAAMQIFSSDIRKQFLRRQRRLTHEINEVYIKWVNDNPKYADAPSLAQWLSDQNLPLARILGQVGNNPANSPVDEWQLGAAGLLVIGGSCVLTSAPDKNIGLAVSILADPSEQSSFGEPYRALLAPGDIEKLSARKEKEIARLKTKIEADSEKVSVRRISQPTSDQPLVGCYTAPTQWSIVRPFHEFMNEDASLDCRQKIAVNAIKIKEEGTSVVTNACCHMIVRLSCGNFLFCQRSRTIEGQYHRSRWSVSIEEQLKPGEDLESCVRRGIAEELLGYGNEWAISFRTLAAILEPKIMNLSFVVQVDIPLEFTDVLSV